jgi:GxxExxY protein
MEGKIIHKELSYRIYGILFKVQNTLGRYKNEKQYGDYFEFLLKKDGLPYVREARLESSFVGEKEGRNICDFIIDGKIIVELKAVDMLTNDYYFQVKRYLSTSGLLLGILVNFRQRYLSPRRVLNNEKNLHS